MKNEDIEEILNKLGAEEVPDDVHKIADEISRDFSKNLVPKKQPKHYILQEHIMKSRIPKLAVAAAVILVVLVGLPFLSHKEKGVALADVLAKVERARAFMYKMKMNMTGATMTSMPAGEQQMEIAVIISTEYGMKMIWEITIPNGKKISQTAYMNLDQKQMIMIMPEMKKYMQMEFDDDFLAKKREESYDPRYIMKQIMGSEYKELGKSIIDGVEVEGFEASDSPLFGGSGTQVILWVDIENWLPVQMEMDIKIDENMRATGVAYDYQWDIPVEASEFEPVIPEDFTSFTEKPIQIPSGDEEEAIEGLKFFADILGKYPKSLHTMSLMKESSTINGSQNLTEAGLKWKEEMDKIDRQKDLDKVLEIMRPVQSLSMFYMTLVQDKKEPVYYGESVGPDAADAVLIRWKISDDEYRVIFGDLSAENVTAERLAELEK